MLIKRSYSVDSYGKTHYSIDRTFGIPLLSDVVAHIWSKMIRKVQGAVKLVIPRQNATGTYVMRGGKLVKVAGSASCFDIWLKKHGVPEDAGLRQYHNFLAVQEARGKLGEVKDGHVQKFLKSKYGRSVVPMPWIKRDTTRPRGVVI